jgi:hypothetical protein
MNRLEPPSPPHPPESSTGTDPRASSWAISDHVVQLRQLGTQTIYVLPRDPTAASQRTGGLSLGSSRSCDLRVEDSLKRVSRRHAVLLWQDGSWNVMDVGSKNGLFVDGVKQRAARLSPGTIVGVGGLRLVAESLRSIDLRSFLARLLGWGWGDEKDAAIERAMAAIRQAQLQRTAIVLESDSDMIPIARELHRHLFAANLPFVVCDPRRRTSDKDVRMPLNVADPLEALAAASRGTLCVRAERLPEGFTELCRRTQETESAVQLMICVDGSRQLPRPFADAIVIPPLLSRDETEIAQVIREYFLDAIRDLDGPPVPTRTDRTWIRNHSATSLVDVAKGTRRITALRKTKTLAAAAELLGMAGPSLRRWLHHRGMPAGLLELEPDGRTESGPIAVHELRADDSDDAADGDDDSDGEDSRAGVARPSDGVPAVELLAIEPPSVVVDHGNRIPVIASDDRSTRRNQPKRTRRGSKR